MTIHMNDGYCINVKSDQGTVEVDMNLDGYMIIKNVKRDMHFAILIAPRESVSFIDMENAEEAGVEIKAYRDMRQ